MAREHPDLVGQKFGHIEVLEFSHVKQNAYWHCRCTGCGRKRVMRADVLKRGAVSCGCQRNAVHGQARGGRGYNPTYRCWYDMLQRCYNKKCPSYVNYGAKGVTVTRRWMGKGGFDRFLSDMGRKPPNMTLDRINPFGSYKKSNCRWATAKVQSNNQRRHWTGLRRIG